MFRTFLRTAETAQAVVIFWVVWLSGWRFGLAVVDLGGRFGWRFQNILGGFDGVYKILGRFKLFYLRNAKNSWERRNFINY